MIEYEVLVELLSKRGFKDNTNEKTLLRANGKVRIFSKGKLEIHIDRTRLLLLVNNTLLKSGSIDEPDIIVFLAYCGLSSSHRRSVSFIIKHTSQSILNALTEDQLEFISGSPRVFLEEMMDVKFCLEFLRQKKNAKS